MIYIWLEDETCVIQIVHKAILEWRPQETLNSQLLALKGTWQRGSGKSMQTG